MIYRIAEGDKIITIIAWRSHKVLQGLNQGNRILIMEEKDHLSLIQLGIQLPLFFVHPQRKGLVKEKIQMM